MHANHLQIARMNKSIYKQNKDCARNDFMAYFDSQTINSGNLQMGDFPKPKSVAPRIIKVDRLRSDLSRPTTELDHSEINIIDSSLETIS